MWHACKCVILVNHGIKCKCDILVNHGINVNVACDDIAWHIKHGTHSPYYSLTWLVYNLYSFEKNKNTFVL